MLNGASWSHLTDSQLLHHVPWQHACHKTLQPNSHEPLYTWGAYKRRCDEVDYIGSRSAYSVTHLWVNLKVWHLRFGVFRVTSCGTSHTRKGSHCPFSPPGERESACLASDSAVLLVVFHIWQNVMFGLFVLYEAQSFRQDYLMLCYYLLPLWRFASELL